MADVKTFMKLIKAMESSGGKDTRHPTMEAGIHTGDAAIGDYGMMPNTAKQIAAKNQVGPSDEVIKNLPNDQVSVLLKENPELAEKYARLMAEKLMEKTDGDPALGMTGWHYGHNMSKDQLEKKAQARPEYIDKVNQRIGENRLQSNMPNILDMLEQPYKDEPMSKKRK